MSTFPELSQSSSNAACKMKIPILILKIFLILSINFVSMILTSSLLIFLPMNTANSSPPILETKSLLRLKNLQASVQTQSGLYHLPMSQFIIDCLKIIHIKYQHNALSLAFIQFNIYFLLRTLPCLISFVSLSVLDFLHISFNCKAYLCVININSIAKEALQ